MVPLYLIPALDIAVFSSLNLVAKGAYLYINREKKVTKDDQKKEEWDKAPRLPALFEGWKHCHRRDKKLYDVEPGQYFQRKDDKLTVRIDYASSSGLVLALDVCTNEVYQTFEMEFSTRRIKWGVEGEEDIQMEWCRINRSEAIAFKRRYIREHFSKLVRCIFRRG